MADDIRILPARLDQADDISRLIVGLAAYFAEDLETAQPFLTLVAPEAIAGYLSNPAYRYFVALGDGKLLGVIGMRDDSHLYHLFVAPDVHRRGLARSLWEEAKQAARAAGNPGRFTVNSSVYAVPVYERFGFKVTGSVMEKDGVQYVPMELSEEPLST